MDKETWTKTTITLFAAVAVCAGVATGSTLAADAEAMADSALLYRFGYELLTLDRQCTALQRQPALTHAEFDAVRAEADRLKARGGAAQRAFRAFIDQLKAVRQWDVFDALAMRQTRHERLRVLLRHEGGAQRLLERAATLDLARAIDAVLGPLHAKLTVSPPRDEYSFAGLTRATFAPATQTITALDILAGRATAR